MIKQIILHPHITEKTMQLVSKKKYTFKVAQSANKPEIMKSIKKMYKVNPINVKIINLKEKILMFRSKYKGKRKKWKKAIITLPKKESIKEFVIKE